MTHPHAVQSGLRLLPAEALLRTGDVDHADWNYRPLLGHIQRLRFHMVASLLKGRRYRRLLEIGYGSGVFMPELARHSDQLFGIDPHPHAAAVQQALATHGVSAQLCSGSATELPYPDGFFDAVVVVSALEFIPDLPAACHEITRVLAPGGVAVVVTPGHSTLLDLGLKLLTGESAKDDFGTRRQAILPTLLRHFRPQRRIHRPRVIHRLFSLYTALVLQPLPQTDARPAQADRPITSAPSAVGAIGRCHQYAG